MKLSIVILNYNTVDHLKACLQSIKQSKDKIKKETIVVDNDSIDQSIFMVKKNFPQVKLIKNKTNLGYSAGNNLGLKKAKGDLILLLNSDTKILPTTLTTMTSFMDQNPGVGVSTCKVILESGELDPASHRGFPSPWNSFTYFTGLEKLFPRTKLFGGYHQGWKDMSKPHEIDSPAGAFYLTRKKVLNKVGLLDERFFIYAEDLDLSMRIKQAGWKIMFVPSTKIIHLKKSSGRRKKTDGNLDSQAQSIRHQTSQHFFETMKIFYSKHYQNQYPAPVRWLTLLGIWIVSKFKN